MTDLKRYQVYYRNSDGDVYMKFFSSNSVFNCINENNLTCYDLISIHEVGSN